VTNYPFKEMNRRKRPGEGTMRFPRKHVRRNQTPLWKEAHAAQTNRIGGYFRGGKVITQTILCEKD